MMRSDGASAHNSKFGDVDVVKEAFFLNSPAGAYVVHELHELKFRFLVHAIHVPLLPLTDILNRFKELYFTPGYTEVWGSCGALQTCRHTTGPNALPL